MSKPVSRQPGPGPGFVRLAIPNKGRIAGPINELIEKSGLHLVDGGERRLITRTRDPNVEILFARPIDIPEYVASGVADLGITGRDMVMERGSVVEQVLDLQTGRATLVVAVPEESGIETIADLAGAKIATEFPAITRAFFAGHGIAVTVVTVGGHARRRRTSGSPTLSSTSPPRGRRCGRTISASSTRSSPPRQSWWRTPPLSRRKRRRSTRSSLLSRASYGRKGSVT
jgi:ATP phosphoribosyltransferase